MINYDCPAKHVAPFVQKIIIFPTAKKRQTKQMMADNKLNF